MFNSRGLLLLIIVTALALPTQSGGSVRAIRPEVAEPLAPLAAADAKLSGDIVISGADNEAFAPDVAYNWKHNEYLVVWHTKWAIGSRDIRAARVSQRGEVLGAFTVFEHATKDSAQPAVDYDPVNDRYLVVWVFDAFGDGSDVDLYGRFIPWNEPSASLSEFAIATWTTHQWNPRVAYGRAVEEFLVVWNNEEQAATLPMYISGRRVSADGSGFPGGSTDLTINHATENRIRPDVTYNLQRNQYLVVYGNGADIFGVRLTGNLGHDFGGEFGIAGWSDGETNSAVAACREADQYLVTWQSDQGTANDAIYGRFIDGGGIPGNVYQIDDTTGAEQDADVACIQPGAGYLVAWQTEYVNNRFGIWGRLVRSDESMTPQFTIVHPGQTAHRTRAVVAGGNTHYLVAWEHQRGGTSYQDIHARMVSPFAVFLPLSVRSYQR